MSTAPVDSVPRPNILLLHAHDLGRFLRCYGVRTAHTPHLDRLAAEGVLFARSFATAPQCSPSRASIFTGRHPHCTGMLGLAHPPFGWDLHPDELHLGQILQRAGYRTAGVGILHETQAGPARCGLDEYIPDARAAAVADATIGLLTRFAQASDRPFYLQAGTLETHRLPNREPGRDMGFLGDHLAADDAAGVTIPGYLRDTPGARAELAEFQGSVRHLDAEIGRILETLSRLGLADNTLVLFTTDHGLALPRAKCSLYDPGVETALLLRWPAGAGWSGGRREEALISNLDYLPTLLDAAAVPIPPRVQGRSFAPLLDGGAYQPRDVLFHELTYHDYYDPQRAVRTEDHKLIVHFSTSPAFMEPSQSRRPRSDTVVPKNNSLALNTSLELYDLRHDPWEQKNLAAAPSHADVLDRLRSLLLHHLEETGDPLLQGAVTSPMHHQSADWLRAGTAR